MLQILRKYKNILKMERNTFDIKEIVRFIVSGGIGVSTDFTIYTLLSGMGIPLENAKLYGYISGAAVCFVINKWWTFRRKKFVYEEVLKYILLYSFTAMMNVELNQVMLKIFETKGISFLGTTGITASLHFLGEKFIVFAGRGSL